MSCDRGINQAVMPAVAVYCGSSDGVSGVFTEAARELGRAAVSRGYATVSGAGCRGLMGALVDGTLQAGGYAVGVIPQFMVERKWHNDRMSELHVVDTMHERKALMASLSSGAIALPGGVGTLDELMEIVTWRQLGLYKHPVVILNIDGYYDGLLAMLAHAAECGMMRNAGQDAGPLWYVAQTPDEAMDIIVDNEQ
ncbi:MAG: TIGR00730 family Rossman fold protein [Muribaculaceae bacterium]|nr:TIGR00730 family Rossman fold protein [Muribaculaceae bacterium]